MILHGVAGPAEAENVVVGVAAVSGAVEPVAAVDLEVFEPGVVSVAVVSIADVAEPQASVDIPVAFDVLVPASVVVAVVDKSGRPKFRAFPNVDYFASYSSSFAVVGKESVRSSSGARANRGLYSTLSSLGLCQNRN